MKKISCIFLSVLIAITLCACVKADPSTLQSEPSAPTETTTGNELKETTVDIHEEIVPLDDAGKHDNPFYTRMTDETGNQVFLVKRLKDGETASLPIANTVLYVTKDASNYYEKNTLTFSYNGNTEKIEQYALYVQDAETADPVSASESISQ